MRNFLMLAAFALSILSITYSTQATAQNSTVECDNIATTRSGIASMVMQCGNVSGHVHNDTPLAYIRLVIVSTSGHKRTITIRNPPGSIRDYYALEYNEHLSRLPTLQPNDKVYVDQNGYGLDAETLLYADPQAKEVIGTVRN